jgi:anti-anti-sigma factor
MRDVVGLRKSVDGVCASRAFRRNGLPRLAKEHGLKPSALPNTEFSVHVAPSGDGGTAVTIFGELDLATVDRVQLAMNEAVDASGPVVIDLRACGFVDSRGIGVIAKAAVKLHEEGRALLLKGVQPRIMRTLEIAGLTDWDQIEIEPEPQPK